jgi:hypothetical protein
MSKRKKWRCFHCDEVFTDERSAWGHFGDANSCESDIPACVDPLRFDEKTRLTQLREARELAIKMQQESEDADEKVSLFEYYEDDLRRLFGPEVHTPHQAWLKLEHWQNLDQANRERIATMQDLIRRFVENEISQTSYAELRGSQSMDIPCEFLALCEYAEEELGVVLK